ncbi:AraC family transcriptional regulator [Leptospira sarikeiensis]|uniref:AraC family transcriptional regulator n=1 Tax=Leptospira sarikeiensis TaxID=2484943 RepID=A0A4R9KED3_9LEPT|nr:AraC family transcriptional regulator [Leptospira sarikeiensis]TGL63552.1 AraC family transcriptional regulator [Leptospira sarikeiensis]
MVVLEGPKTLLNTMRVFWNHKASSETYTVLPGENCVIGIQTKGKILLEDGKVSKPLTKAGVTGILTGSRTFSNEKDTRSILIQISPLLLSLRISVPMNELKDQSLSLDHFFSKQELSEFLSDCEEAELKNSDPNEIWQKFWKSGSIKEDKEPFLSEAISRIKNSLGEIGIKGLAKDLGVSQSSLERGFKSRMGLNPKEYASLVRFRNIFKFYNSSTSLTRIGLESGYYDQAHFIREFKRKTGISPKKWFYKNSETLKNGGFNF